MIFKVGTYGSHFLILSIEKTYENRMSKRRDNPTVVGTVESK